MEHIDRGYGEILHQQGPHPYSQYIYTDKKYIYWCINTLNQVADEHILKNPKLQNLKTIGLEYKGITLDIKEAIQREGKYGELGRGNNDTRAKIQFITPTAFKKDNDYAIYPTTRLIFQSLINKYNVAQKEDNIPLEEKLQMLEDHAKIIQYELKSTKFYLKGKTIPSFVGEVTIKSDEKEIVALANKLIDFGEFSGVGIKTTIGMGAIRKI